MWTLERRSGVNHNTWGLTSTELELMEIFWKQEEGISFKNLLDYLNEMLGKEWKRQTLSTYLSNLQRLGLVSSNGQRKNSIYYATCTKDEYEHVQTQELVRKCYDNSLVRFLSAFTGGQKLSKKEADSLKKMLDEYAPDNE